MEITLPDFSNEKAYSFAIFNPCSFKPLGDHQPIRLLDAESATMFARQEKSYISKKGYFYYRLYFFGMRKKHVTCTRTKDLLYFVHVFYHLSYQATWPTGHLTLLH